MAITVAATLNRPTVLRSPSLAVASGNLLCSRWQQVMFISIMFMVKTVTVT